MKEWACS